MPTFLSLASFETRIVSYLVIYLISLMGMGSRQPNDIKPTLRHFMEDKKPSPK